MTEAWTKTKWVAGLYKRSNIRQITYWRTCRLSLYNGQIQSIGPRYCPSIETKIVTFADKLSHQLFLEPEGVDSNEYYINGFSSSLPIDVQIARIQTVPWFENAQLFSLATPIEYDFFDPYQLKHTLETKIIKNLFLQDK